MIEGAEGTEACCGTTCNKLRMEQEFKFKGAQEFVAYLERNLTEDCSTEAIAKLLVHYKMTTVGLEHA